MELYYLPISPFSHKVLMALYEKNVDFTPKIVNPFLPESRDAYRKLYPLGKIPLLVDNDQHIPESSIIIDYLDELGGPLLIPKTPQAARAVRLADRLADQYLSEAAVTLVFEKLKPEQQRDQNRMQRADYYIEQTYHRIETALSLNTSTFYHGNSFSLADLSLMAGLRITQNIRPLDNFPHLAKFYGEHRQRASFKKVEDHAETEGKAIFASMQR